MDADHVENYDKKVSWCGGADINVEVYQGQINQKYNTKFDIPIVYYSTLMSVAYDKGYKQSGLNGQMIKTKQLDDIVNK